MENKTPMNYFWLIAVVALFAGAMGGLLLAPDKVVEVPGELVEVIVEVPGEIIYVDVPAQAVLDETEVVEVSSEEMWVELAWNQILEEFDNDNAFLSCSGFEFDDDELTTDLEDASISWNEDGDYVVSLDYQFKWEDGSDERNCKVDHSFTVSWDDNDVSDKDWDEAETIMIN